MDIKKRTEALLLAANRALSVKDIVELLEIQSAREESEILSAVVSLKEDYEDKPYDLAEVASGYRIQLNQEYSHDIAKLWEVKPLRLSRATLETLSIISYMQPVTRGDIEDIRGVNVATSVIKVLMDQGWIKIKGYRDVPGRPALFITTQKFLDDFSMKTLDDLPVLPDLPEIENISPELSLQEDSIEQEAPKQ
ncbi:MAG: SMC-Scp complex subunit ScpB [Gammaproteobacteria bacterium TMED112]|nr:MAG: SMC-Scp complex subunit ScpB [Gammaproteobacteria bacterium TMED112]|tara:strand:+ start:15359 stop:15940 length:582 start_codon:yes stop_codon:yes gene_type:complete